MTTAAPLETRVEIETPELVTVTYTIAGIGSRARASLADHAIVLGAMLALLVLYVVLDLSTLAGTAIAAWSGALLIVLVVLGYWGYFVLFEILWDGQTPGKRLARLRVVREGGYSVTFGASAARNLLRFVDMQPGVFHAIAVGGALLDRRGRRLGDLVAGTLVVQEELGDAMPLAAVRRAGGAAGGGARAAALSAALTDAEYALLDGFVARQGDLDAARRTAFVDQLSARFAAPLRDVEGPTAMARLIHLRDAEQAARARGLGARADTGAARERHAIVAQGSARWAAFAATLAEAQRRGLAALGEARTRDFVRDYRELTADLARLRTASRGAAAPDVFHLNRLVAGAHNLVYRRRGFSWRRAAHFLAFDVPAEIRRSSAVIVLAAGLLFFPLGVAWVAVVREPSVAATLLPPAMLDRADEGVRRAQEETGYIPDPAVLRPVMAGGIIANNVRVAIAAFASGITAGVGTVLLLVSNGVSIGAVLGLYDSKGILPLLLAFVAPHGVLELTAIALAGGAGLLLAGVLLVPGERSRRTAFREDAPRALRLVAGTTLLLFAAGAIEGLLSPIPWWPIEGKAAVAGLTALLLYAYVRIGARRVTAPPAP